jgi:hypothetical protein
MFKKPICHHCHHLSEIDVFLGFGGGGDKMAFTTFTYTRYETE